MTRTYNTRVFATTPRNGSLCPVVVDADGWSAERMRRAAKRWGVETAFAVRAGADIPSSGLRLRFFAPRCEMEMCVHGTMAAYAVLSQLGRIRDSAAASVDTVAGAYRVWKERRDRIPVVSVSQSRPEFTGEYRRKHRLASALQVPARAICPAGGRPETVSTSRPKLLVAVRSRTVLRRMDPDHERLWEICDEAGATGVYCYSFIDRRRGVIEARHFPSRAGYLEDGATGLAASALGAYLAREAVQTHDVASLDPPLSFTVIQGIGLGRESRISVTVPIEIAAVGAPIVSGTVLIEGIEIAPPTETMSHGARSAARISRNVY